MKRLRDTHESTESTVVSVNKKQKVKKEFRDNSAEVSKIPPINRCLDELARLFQMTSQGCAAVSLINQTIIIADNEIHAGSDLEGQGKRGVSSKVQLIRTVMKYFSDFANSHNLSKSREEVFKELCTARLKGEEKGYIKLDDIIIEKISVNVLNTYKIKNAESWHVRYAKEIDAYEPHQRPFVSLAHEMAGLVARDFLKIENLIKSNINDDAANDLVTAFKGQENEKIHIDQAGGIHEKDRGSVQYGDEAGYIILNIDTAGVHAEAKIIEYLIFTDVIQNLEEGEKVYVGISKLCCRGCNEFVKAVNKVFGSEVEIIQIRGTHELQPAWIPPIICNGDAERVIGYYWSDKLKKYEVARSQSQEGLIKYTYLVSLENISNLNKLTPQLKKATTIEKTHQTIYSSNSPSTQSHDAAEENFVLKSLTIDQLLDELRERYNNEQVDALVIQLRKELKNLEDMGPKEDAKSRYTEEVFSQDVLLSPHKPNHVDHNTRWYDSLAIKDCLIKKGISAEHILDPVKNNEELDQRLAPIKESNAFYIIPLNVNALDGSFVDTNHWVGLYITTGDAGAIESIKYINPIGQKINNSLSKFIKEKTTIAPEDVTEGIMVQFAYTEDSGIEMTGNDYDCGPILVQLLSEIKEYGFIQTKPKSLEESIAFGQKCRTEQLEQNKLSNDICSDTILTADTDVMSSDEFPEIDLIGEGYSSSDVV